MYQPNVFGFSERKWNSLRCKEHKSTCFVATESFGYRISKPILIFEVLLAMKLQ